MIDPILERKSSDCRELLNLWRKFHDFFKIGVQGEGVTPEKEHEFITIKSRIAMLHDTFMRVLDHDQNIGQNVLTIVTRSITLKHIRRMSTAEIKKIELEWHESYLLLNEAIGLLDDKRQQFAAVSPSVYYRQLYTKRTKAALTKFFTGWVFRTIAILLVLVVGGYFFFKHGGWEWLVNKPATRKLVIGIEDLIRLAFREFPYRDCISVTRLDATVSKQIAAEVFDKSQDQPGRQPIAGLFKIASRLKGNSNDFIGDLMPAKESVSGVDYRTDACRPAFELGGDDLVVYMYRLKDRQAALNVQSKYNNFQGKKDDFSMFRIANVIGLVFGGDAGGRGRDYMVGQYTHKRVAAK